jgi:hypothetical protein
MSGAVLETRAGDLPRLIDSRGIQEECGVKRATAEAIMRRCTKVYVPGVRKAHVYRDDVLRVLRESEAA